MEFVETERCISRRIVGRAVALLLVATLLPLAGCATLHRNEARRTEKLLAAAGFQARPANSPARLANLEELPPRKLVAREHDGHFVYVYADPDNCRCLYVGGPQEYSAYERLSLKKEIADEEYQAGLDWDAWGPWWW